MTAALVCLVAWSMSLTALGLELGFGLLPADDPGYYADPVYFSLDVAMGLLNAPAAALVLARSRHVAGWLAALVSIGFAAAALSLTVALLAQERGGVAGLGFWAHGFSWLWIPGSFLAVTVLPWYLRDDAPGPRARLMGRVGAALTATVTLVAATRQQDGAPANPLALDSAGLEAVGQVAMVGLAVVGTAAVVHLARRSRDETAEARRALATFAVGLGALVASFTVLTFWPEGAGRDVVTALAVPVLYVSQIFMPLAIVLLVLGAGLWGVDVAVSRATVWTLLTGGVVALYLLVVWLVGRVLPVDDEVAGLLAAASLALAVQPLRTWLQRRVDRIVYGSDSDPVSLLARMGEQLRGGRGSGTLPALVDSLRAGLRLGAVEVIAHEAPAVSARSAGRGVRERSGHDAVVLPLVVEHREIGSLLLQALPGQRLDLRTVRIARHLSDVVAVSLDLAQANQRLRAASQRLGEVRHEERRMLRRELHDGLGPSLAGVGLALAAARRRLAHDVPGTLELLTGLETELARRTDDVRLLARSLLPAQLDEGNLAEALGVLAQRFAGSGLRIGTECEAEGLDTRHQIAIYHVAAEAVLNAYRHAGASRVDVEVTSEGGGAGDDGREAAVVLTVTDDGVGVAPDHQPGVGLQSMRERADELGGTLTVTSGPEDRGTQVRMVLP